VKSEYNYSPIEIYDTSERVEGSRFDELMESEGMTYCKEKCAYWGDDPRGPEYGTVWVACPHGDEEQTLLPTFLRIEWVGEHDHWAHELKTDYFASWAGTHVQSRRILNSSGKRLN